MGIVSIAAKQKATLIGALCVAVVIIMFSGGTEIQASEPWSPRAGCTHVVKQGQTLSKIGNYYGVTANDIANTSPLVTDIDLIHPGDVLDICAPDLSALSHPLQDSLYGTRISELEPKIIDVDPPDPDLSAHPGHIVEWAQAVMETRPDRGTDADVRFLVAVIGPESTHCTRPVNEGDRNPPKWGPSVGCPQIRTLLRASDLAREPYRDRVWLESSFENQAIAAWWVLYEPWGGRQAWGPTKDGKMPQGDPSRCHLASSPSNCETWWRQADAALHASQ